MTILFADRSERGKLRFRGPQRAWFLHQILTQSFEDMAPGEDRDAALITAHGRMIGFLEFYALEDQLLAHYEPELKGTFPAQIERYVFATQVEIEDVSDAMGLVLVAGEGWGALAGEVAPGTVTHPTRSLGIPAGYVWVASGEKAGVLDRLARSDARRAEESELEAIRIEHGVPRWGREMDEKTIPQEVGLDRWAVHYDKGCYVGQEAMAKIHFRGKVNRRLARLEGEGIPLDADVVAEGTKVGRVTSVADGRALALVRRSVEPGAEVQVGDSAVKVTA